MASVRVLGGGPGARHGAHAGADDQPDMAILDLQSEPGTALHPLQQIKRSCAPVVSMLSNYDLPPLRQAALAAGADHFLIKASESGRLQKVRPALGRKSQQKN